MATSSKYLVILDSRSVVGQMYLEGTHDGFVRVGDAKHPVLDCIEIETDSPYYIRAIRTLERIGGSSQTLYLPHSSVVVIYEYAKEERPPIGFHPPSDS